MTRALVALLLTTVAACLDPAIEPCDDYLDYLCACEPDACEQRRAVFEGAGASLQETCRIQLACFEDADVDGGFCHLFEEEREEECAPA
jgi:hypothetical protein